MGGESGELAEWEDVVGAGTGEWETDELGASFLVPIGLSKTMLLTKVAYPVVPAKQRRNLTIFVHSGFSVS